MPEAGQSEKMHFFTHTIKIVNNERAYTIESTWKSFVQFDDVSPCKPVIILFTTHTQSSFLRFFCLHYMSVLRDFFFLFTYFFFTTAAWKKTVCGHSFLFDCVYICLCQAILCDVHFTDFLMTHIVPIFSIYCDFFSLLLTFSPYFVSFASYSCMFVHFIILHVLEHSYALIL